MFLTVHGAVGLAASQYFANPLLAFLVGFILHYVFDIIPHGDTRVSKKYWNPIHITLAGLIDISILFSLILLYIWHKGQLLPSNQIMAILGSILPDLIQFLYFFCPKNKLMTKINNFHEFFHGIISKKFEFNLYWGLIFQLLILIIFILITIL
jgi:hypothetical protein